MATEEERSRLEAWELYSVLVSRAELAKLDGQKCRNKLYELWWEPTYLWHRVKPESTVRSVPKADIG